MEIEITEANFETEVLKSEKPVLVDFWADWCGPCKMLAPSLKEIAEENDSIKVGKINVDEEQNLAKKFGIVSIPTVILFKNGEIASTSIGLVPKSKLESMFK